jgi:hypothetical protein
MTTLIKVTDSTTVPELMECLALLSRSAHTEGRMRRCDALLDEILVRREPSSLR